MKRIISTSTDVDIESCSKNGQPELIIQKTPSFNSSLITVLIILIAITMYIFLIHTINKLFSHLYGINDNNRTDVSSKHNLESLFMEGLPPVDFL